MGLCKSCIEKYKKKYLARGFNDKTAERMAVKLLKRIRRRQRYEILKSLKSTFMCRLYRWCFLTQWRATLLASFRSFPNLSFTWIGRGYNPDYTQACAGTCAINYCDNYMGECVSSAECQQLGTSCPMGTCDCPTPLANSTEVSNSCLCGSTGYKCTTCSSQLCRNISYNCACTGTCGYNCDTGYSWNGSQCVVSVAKAPVMDGLVYAD